MTQDVHPDGLDVVRVDEAASIEKRAGPCRSSQRNGGSRRGPVLNHRFKVVQPERRGLARRKHQLDDVVDDFFVDVDGIKKSSRGENLFRRSHGLRDRYLSVRRHAPDDLLFLVPVRVPDDDLHHETIDLRFGQRIGSLLLDRILRREDQERIGKIVCLTRQGDFAFLHRLEQRRLHLRRSAVDLVCEHEIPEHRTFPHRPITGLGIVDLRSEEIGRQEIRGELNATTRSAERRREGLNRHRLGQSGNAFEEHVTVGEDADEHAADEVTLPDDDALDLLNDVFQERAFLPNTIGDGGNIGHGIAAPASFHCAIDGGTIHLSVFVRQWCALTPTMRDLGRTRLEASWKPVTDPIMNQTRRRTSASLLLLLLTLGAAMPPAAGQVPGVTREQMWFAPTTEDWKKPCLIRWQRTWDDALAVSRETGKAILICVNMDGEIASEHYAGVRYRQPDIAKLYEPYVTVIASVYRHTPRDHDENGERIPCPRFGTVTCGEHIAIEPILYEQFFDGERVAPRHVMVELDGNESYDLYYAFDTDSVFKTVRDGIANRTRKPKPIVKGDRTIIERVVSHDSEDRDAVEAAYRQGDASLRRALLDAALASPDNIPVDLLRMALAGFDEKMAARARKALMQAKGANAVDALAEALQVPLEDDERNALLAAMKRIGTKSAKARKLTVVYQGLGGQSYAMDAKGWSGALEGQDDGVLMGEANIESRLKNQDDVYGSKNAAAHLDLAEAFLANAVESPPEDRITTNALFADARDAALEAEKLDGDKGRVNTVLAVVAWYLGEKEEAYRRAEIAVKELPKEPTGWNSMVVLGLFAEARRNAISDAVRDKKDWPGQWLTDLHSAYSVLARHPFGDPTQVQMHYDFLVWLQADGQAGRVLTRGIARFPEASGLHDRLRRYTLKTKGVRGLENVYGRMLAKKGTPAVVRWYAGYAACQAAEFHRRRGRAKRAIAAYDRRHRPLRTRRRSPSRTTGIPSIIKLPSHWQDELASQPRREITRSPSPTSSPPSNGRLDRPRPWTA